MQFFNLLQQPVPATQNYMIAGFAVIFGVMLIYLVSLAIRNRNLHQDLEILEEMEMKGDEQLPVVERRTTS